MSRPGLSSRRTAEEPARGLASLSGAQQEFALHWTGVIQKSNSEMAYQFVSHVPRALGLMGIEGARLWLLGAMDIYDKEGLYPGSAAFGRVAEFAREYRLSHVSVTLDEVRPVLERFICGLAGRSLKLEAGERSYTTPKPCICRRASTASTSAKKTINCTRRARSICGRNRGSARFRRPAPGAPHLVQQIADLSKHADDHGRVLKLFNLLETVRLSACIQRELPGLAREILALDAAPPVHDSTWKKFIARLEAADATVADTVAATAALYPCGCRGRMRCCTRAIWIWRPRG